MEKRKYAITSCPTGEEVKVTVKEMTNDEVKLVKDIFGDLNIEFENNVRVVPVEEFSEWYNKDNFDEDELKELAELGIEF